MKSTTFEGISFVIPCYNSGDYLIEAVNSLIGQPHVFPYEIVIVDDGSDDEATLSSISACGERSEVRVIRLSRSGHHAARNAGVEAARFEYVMQLDADDRLATAPELLTGGSYPDRAVEILRAQSDVAFVHTMSRMIGEFDGLTISSYPCREELVLRKHHVPTSIVYRRADAVRGGMYDPRVLKWGDWAFAVNLLAGRFRKGAHNAIVCIAGPLHEYRVHSRGRRVSNAAVAEFDMTLLVVEKNLDLFQYHFQRDDCAEDIARHVLASKPSRLDDLIRMATHDVEQALMVARQREFSLSSPFECLGIP
ncbi:glycosyltransferase family 2 protein [Streptomyces sp. CA-210063]|uniref:glycosyltransferase family 2 protein n=1 Tax=Streptomyces sp. CA-210063 TaxID=2801029 RepID=UPI00214C0EB1|nr:glycosyltransferase family A protein [Streptomyces sp. CA-210063]UUU33633.1 glycosyltransferase family 2 protein [Streptomyces sp. CA-210063]